MPLAEQVHGATYVVDCEFRADELVAGLNWVINIADAQKLLDEVIAQYNYKNLDDVEKLAGQNTTTEFMCYQVFCDMKERLSKAGIFSGGELCVKMSESHVAWASYTGKM